MLTALNHLEKNKNNNNNNHLDLKIITKNKNIYMERNHFGGRIEDHFFETRTLRREKEESTGKDQVHQVCFSFAGFQVTFIHSFTLH